MEYYSVIKNENAICSHMDTTRDKYAKWSQKEKDKYYITYVWNLKYGTSKPIYKSEADSQTENRLVTAKGDRVREGRTGSLGLADMNYFRMDK